MRRLDGLLDLTVCLWCSLLTLNAKHESFELNLFAELYPSDPSKRVLFSSMRCLKTTKLFVALSSTEIIA